MMAAKKLAPWQLTVFPSADDAIIARVLELGLESRISANTAKTTETSD
jgi:hypothetical protein